MSFKELLSNMLNNPSESKTILLYEHNTALLNFGIKAKSFLNQLGVMEEFKKSMNAIERYGLEIVEQMKKFNRNIKNNDNIKNNGDNSLILKCEECPDSEGCEKKPLLKKLIKLIESEDIE